MRTRTRCVGWPLRASVFVHDQALDGWCAPGAIFGSPLCPQGIGQEEMNAKLLHSGFAALHMFLHLEVTANASDASGSG